MTPAIFDTSLKLQNIRFDDVTLLIFDECHHAHSDNHYNRIMGRYLVHKLFRLPVKLPQVGKRNCFVSFGLVSLF